MKATTLWVGAAVLRAVESYRPTSDRLFHDDMSLALLPPHLRGFIQVVKSLRVLNAVMRLRDRQYPGAIGNLLCRTRYIDDALASALRAGADQVVILGAGFDTRAYRTPGIQRSRVFEVDHPSVQSTKKDRLRRVLGTLPPYVSFVPTDFEKDGLKDAMTEVDFEVGQRTFFIWEGVTQYISAKAVDSTLRDVMELSGLGSRIALTYIDQGIIDGSTASASDRKLMSLMARFGVPWIFGLHPTDVSDWLAARGIELVEQVGSPEYRSRYLQPAGRDLVVFEGERTALGTIRALRGVEWG